MLEVAVLGAALYLAAFLMLGGPAVHIAFGDNYEGQAAVTGALALMWALRFLQAPFGAMLMTAGDNRPFLVAGLIRASALLPTLLAARAGAPLAMLGLIGAAGEAAALVYLAWRIGREGALLPRTILIRTAFLALAPLVTMPFWAGSAARLPLPSTLLVALAIGVFVFASAAAMMPAMRDQLGRMRAAI